MMIEVNGEKRNVGNIYGNRFITFRNDIHHVKKYDGFGISKVVLAKLIEEDIEEIVVIYKKGAKKTEKYKISPENWFYRGYRDKLGAFEEQIFLPLNLFTYPNNKKDNKNNTNSSLSSYTGGETV